jgi:hypothetical protein
MMPAWIRTLPDRCTVAPSREGIEDPSPSSQLFPTAVSFAAVRYQVPVTGFTGQVERWVDNSMIW